jgi:hypothetical protein
VGELLENELVRLVMRELDVIDLRPLAAHARFQLYYVLRNQLANGFAYKVRFAFSEKVKEENHTRSSLRNNSFQRWIEPNMTRTNLQK